MLRMTVSSHNFYFRTSDEILLRFSIFIQYKNTYQLYSLSANEKYHKPNISWDAECDLFASRE